METLIDGGSAAASHRLHPMQQQRTGHVRVFGESQSTGCEACEWEKRLTQGRLVEGEGGISICPRLKWIVTLMTTRGCCPTNHQTKLGRPRPGRGTSQQEEQVFQRESSTLGWMILPLKQNLLPLICTRFHEVFGADGSDCIGKLHRCGIEKHAGLSNWCAIWLRGLDQSRSVRKVPERCGSNDGHR